MSSLIYLAGRYLLFNRWKTGVLVAAITTIIFLPLALELLLDRSATRLTARAQATPLFLGSPGSPLELVLNSLYFSGDAPADLDYSAVRAVTDSDLANPIPLYVRYRVGSQPLVGTSPDYFRFRGLEVEYGRGLAISGEAVLGSAAAAALAVGPGDGVVTAPETVFDVAGTYPLKLNVVGVLRPTATPDDEAVFVDVRTAWIVGGIGHGHDELDEPDSADSVLRRDGDNIVANAALVQYREVTPENLNAFHFHGDTGSFPISAVIVAPRDEKSGVLLEGRYQDPTASVRVVKPESVMADLLGTVLTVRQYVLVAVGLVGLATIATAALVFLLSIRLRHGEIQTMTRIGAAPAFIWQMLGLETLLVLLTSLFLAGLLTALAASWGDALFRFLLLSAGS